MMPAEYVTPHNQINHRQNNHHCTCIKIGDCGIMIEGPSGSGKTSLALGLLEEAQKRNLYSALICDDQAFLVNRNTSLFAHCPPTLRGKVELYGHGIIKIDHIEKSRIHLVCKQTPQNDIARMPEPLTCTRSGIKLPLLKTPERHEAMGVRIVFQTPGLLS